MRCARCLMFKKLLVASGLLTGLSMLAWAHPMGNFSINHYARFDVRPQEVGLTYALDFADLPTFELLKSWSLDGRDRDAVTARAVREAQNWLTGIRISVDGNKAMPKFQHASARSEEHT